LGTFAGYAGFAGLMDEGCLCCVLRALGELSGLLSKRAMELCGKRALCFSDGARMSCYANDYGYDKAFSQFIKEFADKNSLVILISSSGNSKNILNCADYCKTEGIAYITLTGFDEYNQINDKYSDSALHGFWIDSTDYGVVECAHEAILHSVI
jgi:D-sedoheptulose 7-phosphate isomerase